MTETPSAESEEFVDVVDENDVIQSTMPRTAIYGQPLYIRCLNIAIIDPETQNIAIQRRGKNLRWMPDHYCISVCGHNQSGETWEEAACRELHEEMGVEAPLNFIDKIPFTDRAGNNFILGVFTARIPHEQLRGHAREVGKIFSMNADEIRALITKGEKLHNLFVPVMEKVLEKLEL